MAVSDLDDTLLILEEVRQELATRELTLPTKPGSEAPKLPGDITSVSSDHLMELMVKYDTLRDYADTVAAEAETKAAIATNRYSHLRAHKHLDLLEQRAAGTSMTLDEIKARLDTDPDLRKLKEEELKAVAFRTMVRPIATSYERRGALLSRELTRRTNRREPE